MHAWEETLFEKANQGYQCDVELPDGSTLTAYRCGDLCDVQMQVALHLKTVFYDVSIEPLPPAKDPPSNAVARLPYAAGAPRVLMSSEYASALRLHAHFGDANGIANMIIPQWRNCPMGGFPANEQLFLNEMLHTVISHAKPRFTYAVRALVECNGDPFSSDLQINALDEAIRRGYHKVVAFFLDIRKGYTNVMLKQSLHMAIVKRHRKVVDVLLSEFIDLSRRTRKNKAYVARMLGGELMVSAAHDDEMALRLLDVRADVAPGHLGENTYPLEVAVRRGSVVLAKRLVCEGACIHNGRNSSGNASLVTLRTPLYIAVDFGHLAMAEMLLRRLADPNGLCKGEWCTPLTLAAAQANVAMVDVLLRGKADPNAPRVIYDGNDDDSSEIEATCYEPLYKPLYTAVNLQNKHIARDSPAHVNCVRKLIAAKASVNAMNGPSEWKESPLMRVTRLGTTPLILMLLEARANVVDRRGTNALRMAQQKWGEGEITQLLRRAGSRA
eukprot:GEMP01006117.1.p1 GENE.GEMP01006117.1~~GEMP01006117.1.p1  ORF type:complete len:499 (-),score=102.24 GEMP01006117.1:795-2291(-)